MNTERKDEIGVAIQSYIRIVLEATAKENIVFST